MKNRKKLYYITNFTSKNPFDKVNEQVKLFHNNGFEVVYIDVTKNVSSLQKICGRFPFIDSNVNLSEFENITDNSLIYIRYFQSNRKILKALKNLRKRFQNIKIAVEIPTYPYDGEFQHSSIQNRLKSWPIYIKDKRSRKKLYKYIDRIVTFSDDKKIWGIKTLNISNGVNLDRINIRQIKNWGTNTINMIAVAKFGFWHGYDRLIKGLGEYYKNSKNKRDIKLYLVGAGDKKVIKEYKSLVNRYDLDEHVFFTGKKIGQELDDLYNNADLGIDSMGRYRSGVTYNSTLKGKEYLAKGLPIVSGVKTELDSMLDFKYYYRVPADDSVVDIKGIINFYDMVYQKDKRKVAQDIRTFCVENFDLRNCYNKLINWYNE